MKKRLWEEQLEYMVKHREKENEKQIKELLKKNSDVFKTIYKTDKLSDIKKALREKNGAENKKEN